MSDRIDITDVDLRALVREAYNLSAPKGLGYLHFVEGALDEATVEAIVTAPGGVRMDYVRGRQVKLWVREENGRRYLPTTWYDHTASAYRLLLTRVGAPLPEQEV